MGQNRLYFLAPTDNLGLKSNYQMLYRLRKTAPAVPTGWNRFLLVPDGFEIGVLYLLYGAASNSGGVVWKRWLFIFAILSIAITIECENLMCFCLLQKFIRIFWTESQPHCINKNLTSK